MREPDMTEMEWRCRNGLYFTWLSGAQIVQQNVLNIDVVNWAIGATPKNIAGTGRRQVAASTTCAVVGRMITYTGRAISWEWTVNASKLDLSPERHEFDPTPVGPVAVPRVTPLI